MRDASLCALSSYNIWCIFEEVIAALVKGGCNEIRAWQSISLVVCVRHFLSLSYISLVVCVRHFLSLSYFSLIVCVRHFLLMSCGSLPTRATPCNRLPFHCMLCLCKRFSVFGFVCLIACVRVLCVWLLETTSHVAQCKLRSSQS
jgi:hypothetical protein